MPTQTDNGAGIICSGLDDDAAAEPRLLEVDQGDAISGKVGGWEQA